MAAFVKFVLNELERGSRIESIFVLCVWRRYLMPCLCQAVEIWDVNRL